MYYYVQNINNGTFLGDSSNKIIIFNSYSEAMDAIKSLTSPNAWKIISSPELKNFSNTVKQSSTITEHFCGISSY